MPRLLLFRRPKPVPIIRCANCQTPIPAGTHVCPGCGRPVVKAA